MTQLNNMTTSKQWKEEKIVSLLYKNGNGAMIGSVTNIAIISAVLLNIFPAIEIFTWFLAGEILNLVRYFAHKRYFKDSTRLSTQTWLLLSRIFTTLSGLLYGLLAIFFFSSENHLYQMLVILLPAGMGAAAVGTHSIDLLTYRLFLFLSVVPLVIRVFLEGTEAHAVTSAMLCLLMLIMLRAAKQYHDVMIDNIEMNYSLHYRATHDGLVGLLNREEFRNIFNATVASTPIKNSTTSIIFIDLDNFKNLNDTFGHQAGDDALIKISDIIRSSLRKSDTAARFGGDEFMILIQSDSIDEANVVAQKILDKIKYFQQELKQTTVKLGASIGIGYSYTSIEYSDLLKAADQACYKAKNDGKGMICLKEI